MVCPDKLRISGAKALADIGDLPAAVPLAARAQCFRFVLEVYLCWLNCVRSQSRRNEFES